MNIILDRKRDSKGGVKTLYQGNFGGFPFKVTASKYTGVRRTLKGKGGALKLFDSL